MASPSAKTASGSGDERGVERAKRRLEKGESLLAKCPLHDVPWLSDPGGVFHAVDGSLVIPSECYRELLGWTKQAMMKWVIDQSQDLTGTKREQAQKLLARIIVFLEPEEGR